MLLYLSINVFFPRSPAVSCFDFKKLSADLALVFQTDYTCIAQSSHSTLSFHNLIRSIVSALPVLQCWLCKTLVWDWGGTKQKLTGTYAWKYGQPSIYNKFSRNIYCFTLRYQENTKDILLQVWPCKSVF